MSAVTRRIASGFAVATMLAAAVPALAATDPAAPGRVDGTVTIAARSVALGVGISQGTGTLSYHGHRYPFQIRGISVADIGFSRLQGRGRVYNLHRLEDFNGTYAASTGEATAGRGVAGQALVNSSGVQVRIDSVTQGAELAGSADGIQFKLLR